MREFVGYCESCSKEIFCLDGFLNGVWEEENLYCFDCKEELSSGA
jgi:hypothetical protein